jgi:hypothetical protein
MSINKLADLYLTAGLVNQMLEPAGRQKPERQGDPGKAWRRYEPMSKDL